MAGQGEGRMYRWRTIARESEVTIDQSRVHFPSTPNGISFHCPPRYFFLIQAHVVAGRGRQYHTGASARRDESESI